MLTAVSIGKRRGGRSVLSAASLSATPGEVTALVGRSGAGKTTLLNICAGLMRPDTGCVLWNRSILSPHDLGRFAAEGLMFVPDYGFFGKNLAVGAQLALLAHRYARPPIDASLRAAGADGIKLLRPAMISGGLLRRAEVAAAIIRAPTCLLLDEPFRGTDPLVRVMQCAQWRALAACGAAVVLTGHEVSDIFSVADRIVWCDSGTTYDLGPPSIAAQNERFRLSYLGLASAGERIPRPPALRCEPR